VYLVESLPPNFIFKYSKLNTTYKNLQEKVSGLISELNKPLRLGYYKISCTQGIIKYDAIIYVYELDRYTNGDSSIKLKNINITI
jgi:hypothetical protein